MAQISFDALTVVDFSVYHQTVCLIVCWSAEAFNARLVFAGSCTVRWENKTMYCIVSVFGLAI